jgi:RNA polymerase sigma-70 factor (ECF subfamily)
MASDTAASSPELDSLIERCLNGDQAAWTDIVRLYWRRVFNIAYKFVGRHDEAEDLTQDVFLKLFRSLGTFDRRANFSTWLISVSRNLCIDHYRSVRREREAINPDVDVVQLPQPSREANALTALEERDRVTLVRAALERLTPSLRAAIVLRDLQELSYQDIATQLHLPEGTVKSRINRGRAELARQIARMRASQDQISTPGAKG